MAVGVESFVSYSLSVSWNECDDVLWGADCEISTNSMKINEESVFTLDREHPMRTIALNMNGNEDTEVEMLAQRKSKGNRKLCVAYHYGTPLSTNEINSGDSNCGEESLLYQIPAGAQGDHFFTFYSLDDSVVDFSVLFHPNTVPVQDSLKLLADSSVRVEMSENESNTLSFYVSESVDELQIDIEEIAGVDIKELTFSLVPASQRAVQEARVQFSLPNEHQDIRLISPVLGKWLLSIEAPQQTKESKAVLAVRLRTPERKTQQITGQVPQELSSRSWNYFEVLATKGRSEVIVEVNQPMVLLFALRDANELPSATNFDEFSYSGKLQLPLDYSLESSWRVASYNLGSKEAKAQKKSSMSMKQINAQIQTGDPTNGADTRVTIFIWTTFALCGGIIVISTIALIVWLKRAWAGLKESGAYDMLRNQQ